MEPQSAAASCADGARARPGTASPGRIDAPRPRAGGGEGDLRVKLHLITGGGGYLGSHLARRLVRDGHRVRTLDVAQACPLPEGVELVTGDIRDPEALRRAADGADVVHH